jgi:hypothetical protein
VEWRLSALLRGMPLAHCLSASPGHSPAARAMRGLIVLWCRGGGSSIANRRTVALRLKNESPKSRLSADETSRPHCSSEIYQYFGDGCPSPRIHSPRSFHLKYLRKGGKDSEQHYFALFEDWVPQAQDHFPPVHSSYPSDIMQSSNHHTYSTATKHSIPANHPPPQPAGRRTAKMIGRQRPAPSSVPSNGSPHCGVHSTGGVA